MLSKILKRRAADRRSMNFFQATREELRKRKAEFGDALGKENDVGIVIDGDVSIYCGVLSCFRTHSA